MRDMQTIEWGTAAKQWSCLPFWAAQRSAKLTRKERSLCYKRQGLLHADFRRIRKIRGPYPAAGAWAGPPKDGHHHEVL
jgi:hypothetical protein